MLLPLRGFLCLAKLRWSLVFLALALSVDMIPGSLGGLWFVITSLLFLLFLPFSMSMFIQLMELFGIKLGELGYKYPQKISPLLNDFGVIIVCHALVNPISNF